MPMARGRGRGGRRELLFRKAETAGSPRIVSQRPIQFGVVEVGPEPVTELEFGIGALEQKKIA